MSARRERASEGNVERGGVSQEHQRGPESLWVCGCREQREVELTNGKSPGEKSVHLPIGAGLDYN